MRHSLWEWLQLLWLPIVLLVVLPMLGPDDDYADRKWAWLVKTGLYRFIR